MIHYQLRCAAAHEFDAWFRSSAAFDQQAAGGLLQCPFCGDTGVVRALMAPAVARGAAAPEAAPPPSAPEASPAPAQAAPVAAPAISGPMPDQLRAALQKLRAEVERRCDDVGADFAREARRIHRGEAQARGIYGQATPEQAEELADEGIQVARLPWVKRAEG